MDVRLTAVPELARLCRDETTRYLNREHSRDDFCLELLRRAIVERDQAAWAAVVGQYRGMVLSWQRRGYGTAMQHEDDDHWVNRTFERLFVERAGDTAGIARVPNLGGEINSTAYSYEPFVLGSVGVEQAG